MFLPRRKHILALL